MLKITGQDKNNQRRQYSGLLLKGAEKHVCMEKCNLHFIFCEVLKLHLTITPPEIC